MKKVGKIIGVWQFIKNAQLNRIDFGKSKSPYYKTEGPKIHIDSCFNEKLWEINKSSENLKFILSKIFIRNIEYLEVFFSNRRSLLYFIKFRFLKKYQKEKSLG